MLQDATPDLTKAAPWWVVYLPVVVWGVWYVVDKSVGLIRRGRKGQRDDLQNEIAAAVAKYKTAAEEYEVVAKSRKERIEELERELGNSEAEVSRLRGDAEIKRKITDRLQEEVFELQGKVDRLERRLPGVSDGPSSHRG